MTTLVAKSRAGNAVSLDPMTVETFRAALGGHLLVAADAQYDEARTVWNAMVDRRPRVVAAEFQSGGCQSKASATS